MRLLKVLRFSRIKTVLIIGLIFPVNSMEQEIYGISFKQVNNWQAVLSVAKAQHKNIFIDAYTTWCGPCKMMDQNTYQDSALGDIMNKYFINVKVQMDRTVKDKSYEQAWYGDADKLKESAQIDVFPTLLFYTTNGELILKTVGFKSSNTLAKIAQYVCEPQKAREFENILEAYKEGKKNYDRLPDLIFTVKDIYGDKALLSTLIKDYKENFIDKITINQLLTEKNLKFIAENIDPMLIKSSDNFFKACYNIPEKIEYFLGKGSAKYFINTVIIREEIFDKIYLNDKAISKKPNWKKIRHNLKYKYSKLNYDSLLLTSKLNFYRSVKNWNSYSKYKSKDIHLKLSLNGKIDPFFDLNVPAWDAFLNCTARRPLIKALAWSKLSMDLEDPSPNVQFYDTRANLLYKLGRINEAINMQKKAVEVEDSIALKERRKSSPEFFENLQKMLSGVPTWQIK
jgi:thioredoxin-related protein